MALVALSVAPAAVPRAADAVPGAAAKEPPAGPSAAVMRQWSRSCALCHVDGTGGAPRIGRADEWQPRLAKGREVLLQHTVEGFNNMPPLGYCMSCEAEDFRALIDFMTGAAP
ncbi:MAG: c-type cytochrome [Gammaproteobacteria bacterium]|nr:c-type cytochrome [Gammaproteobacteria bacterium]